MHKSPSHLPRDHVAVVLHDGRHDLVPLLNVVQTPGLGHEVDSLGGAPRKNDLARRLGVNERTNLLLLQQ